MGSSSEKRVLVPKTVVSTTRTNVLNIKSRVSMREKMVSCTSTTACGFEKIILALGDCRNDMLERMYTASTQEAKIEVLALNQA